jgi:hypothetical protein
MSRGCVHQRASNPQHTVISQSCPPGAVCRPQGNLSVTPDRYTACLFNPPALPLTSYLNTPTSWSRKLDLTSDQSFACFGHEAQLRHITLGWLVGWLVGCLSGVVGSPALNLWRRGFEFNHTFLISFQHNRNKHPYNVNRIRVITAA